MGTTSDRRNECAESSDLDCWRRPAAQRLVAEACRKRSGAQNQIVALWDDITVVSARAKEQSIRIHRGFSCRKSNDHDHLAVIGQHMYQGPGFSMKAVCK